MKKKIFIYPLIIIGFFLILNISCKKKDENNNKQIPIIVTDIDGNIYHTVTIGTQVWMVENLRVTHYRNGDSIPNVTDSTAWSNLTTGACCWYNNDATTYANTYGALYNWFAVTDSRNIAPTGWHVPTDTEWKTLENYLLANGYNYDGTTTGNKIAKSLAFDAGWIYSSNEGAVGNTDYPTYRNKTGFTALPGGFRKNIGIFINIGFGGYWWSSTEYSQTNVLTRYMLYNCELFTDNSTNLKINGFSVCCVKD